MDSLVRAARIIFLITWTFALLFWVFADVRIAVGNGDLNAPMFDGLPYFTFMTTGLWILVIGVVTLAAYLFAKYSAKR